MKDKIYHFCAFSQLPTGALEYVDGWVVFNSPIKENYSELKALIAAQFTHATGKIIIQSLSLVEGG